jgi:F-type H+-transporting ATPase subunit delta
MSEVITVARPYAKAAFDVAVEHKALDKWLEMLSFAVAVANNDTVQGLLHGSLGTEKLGDLFVQICGDQLNEQGQNLIKVMAENGRLGVLPAVLAEFVALKSELDKQLDASVCSASPLSDADVAKIQASLEKRYGRTVNLNFSIDPSLMAGLVIKAGDDIIDASIRNKLNRLAEALQS